MSSSDAMYRLAVQKNKNRLLQSQTNSPVKTNRLEQINEEMAYWKKRLVQAELNDKDTIIEKLIQLRAEQTTLLIQELHESSAILAKQKTSSIIAAYYADCAKLMAAAQYKPNA